MKSMPKKKANCLSDGSYSLSLEESTRIDILKFLAICFVVYIHAYAVIVNFSEGSIAPNIPIWLSTIENLVSQTIARCGVPLFFLISSILLFKKTRSYLPTLKTKAITLLVPYLAWNTFWIAIFAVLQSVPITASYFSQGSILGTTLQDWLKLYGVGDDPFAYQFWFLRDLIVVTLFFPLVWAVASKAPRICLAFGLAASLLTVDLPFKEALQWFIVGGSIVKLDLHMKSLDNLKMGGGFLLYAFSCLSALIAENSIVTNVSILLGIVFWVKFSKMIYEQTTVRRLFKWLAQWTFIIYAFHELTLSSLKKLCFKTLPLDPTILLFEYIVIPLLVILASVVLGYLLKRLIPGLYRLVSGNR